MMDAPQPPKMAVWLLRCFCKAWYVEVIEGDLYELFLRQYQQYPNKAKWLYTWNVIRFFRWRYIKDLDDVQPLIPFGMFKTYFKVSVRNMTRHRVQSLFNIFGLAIGVACCVLIMTHVRHQLSYDQKIPNLDQIYRVTINGTGPNTPAQLVKSMVSDYPEVTNGVRLSGPMESVVKVGNSYTKQAGIIMTDSTFFDLFPTSFISGSAETALHGPNNAVLTQKVAQKFFGNDDPIGRLIAIDNQDYVVSGVVMDAPKSTTIPYAIILTYPSESWATVGNWTANNFFSYLQLVPNANVELLESKFPEFIKRYLGPVILKYYSQYGSYEEFVEDGHHLTFGLVPMSEIHLNHPRLTLSNPGNYQHLVIFSMVALFIMILACMNYVNMATAKSALRAKEIGMRKVMGSYKGAIAQQFLLESFVISGIAVVLGVGLSLLALPYFNRVSQEGYAVMDVLSLRSIVGFVTIWVLVGLMAGLYPAIYLSSFRPIAALKGESTVGSGSRVRAVLVILQFSVSLFLMVSTVIVFHQLNHMSTRKLGVDAEHVYVLSNNAELMGQFTGFKNQLKTNANIVDVAVSNGFPSQGMADWHYQTVEDHPVSIDPYNVFVDPEVKDVWGLQLIQGRFFNSSLVTDQTAIVVNQKLVEDLGWQEPIGQVLSRGPGEDFKVIGVIANFVTHSAKRGDYPMVLRYESIDKIWGEKYISIKVEGDAQTSLKFIQKVWDSFLPGYPMDGQFMDDSFQKLYESEKRFGTMFTGASILAIVIACLGVFSLAAFVLERKKKEIALRKILGARIDQLFWRISGYFIRLILIAALLALPVTYYLGNRWLEDYVDRISIDSWMMILPLFMVVLIAVMTISYQTYISANKNPIRSIQAE